MTTQMTVNDLTCTLNMPGAVPVKTDEQGNEIPQVLPPYKKMAAHVVDEYPACPADWMHGSDQASSYFIGVESGKGMWLDFNGCCNHTHDVAIVISVQGVNPISGRKLKNNKLRLEQYRKKCPKHDCDFQQDRFCPECGFKWPAQNYLTTTVTPRGLLWLDGFRSGDGHVRQYIFSEEEIKSVAAQVLKQEGDNPDDRVFAIGVAFYLSQKAKAKPVGQEPGERKFYAASILPDKHHLAERGMYFSEKKRSGPMGSGFSNSAIRGDGSISDSNCFAGPDTDMTNTLGEESSSTGAFAEISIGSSEVEEVQIETNLEVGQGAEIDQRVYVDNKNLDYYASAPAGLIYINYATQEDVAKILEAGKRPEKQGGFLENMERAHG